MGAVGAVRCFALRTSGGMPLYRSRIGLYVASPEYRGVKVSETYAWHGESSDLKTHAVGQVKSNGHGIFDLMGNAREWVAQDCSLHRPRCRKALDETLGQTCSSFISMGGEWLNRPDLGSPEKVLEKTYDVALQLAQSSD